MAKTKYEARIRRKIRIRSKIKGSSDRPRLSVYRSNRHISAQIIDDENHRVLLCATTASKGAAADMSGMKKIEKAKQIGQRIAQLSKEKGITKVVFDRSGYRYHGRVMALADAARKGGLDF